MVRYVKPASTFADPTVVTAPIGKHDLDPAIPRCCGVCGSKRVQLYGLAYPSHNARYMSAVPYCSVRCFVKGEGRQL